MNRKSLLKFLDSHLAPIGFERRDATWNRVLDEFVDVIDVQSSKTLPNITLNCGILERSVSALCDGGKEVPFVAGPDCNVRARIGELIDGKDKWWDLQKELEPEQELVQAITNQILPFLDRIRSLSGMRDWLVQTGAETSKYPLPTITLAVVRYRLGEKEEACSMLAELGPRVPGAWKDRVTDVAMRISCS